MGLSPFLYKTSGETRMRCGCVRKNPLHRDTGFTQPQARAGRVENERESIHLLSDIAIYKATALRGCGLSFAPVVSRRRVRAHEAHTQDQQRN